MTPTQKADLLVALLQGETTVVDVCRAHGLEQVQVEGWLTTFLDAGRRALGAGGGLASHDAEYAARLLRATFDTLPALAWRADADGSALSLNRRWLDYTGMTADVARGWGWTAALHPDDIDHVIERWRAIVVSGEPATLEARLRRYDGTYRWVLIQAAPGLDDAGNVAFWCGAQTDIEDRKRAEDAVRESERDLRHVFDGLPGLVCTLSPDGVVELVNQRLFDYLGMTAEKLRDWSVVVHPDDYDRVMTAWSQSLPTGAPYDTVHRIRGANGWYRWFQVRALPQQDGGGRIVRWHALLTDIEDRKRTEETLEESERRLRQLFECIPGMIAVNGADGELEYANQRLLDFVGKDLAYLRQLGWSEILHPEDADPTVEEWIRCFETGEPLDVTFRIARADGVYRWFQARSHPHVDGHGRIASWYALLWDIDDRHHAEEALRTSQTELARVSRIVTVGELAASIAHEVNQPISAVANNAGACLGLLAQPDPPLGEIRDALGEIVDDAGRASAIVHRVQQMARKTPLERVPLDLRDVVGDVLVLARHESERRRVTLRLELPDVLPWVVGDRVQLLQVLLNLVVNGMDASGTVPEAERMVTIRASRRLRDGAAEVVVGVQDAGVGILPEQAARMFEAFYTTKPQGMGMGLAISRSIIAAHGGNLWVEPNEGRGTTFLFSLPDAGAR
ncbi:MAG TPA: PAS domain S-box protein [Candidatus Binatia bacterium]|jgi:PAS domain S-box-containing protein|nr:PAS domain S-box protein [Candidatus Binatia bacterium]